MHFNKFEKNALALGLANCALDLPPQEISTVTLREKYAKGNEITAQDVRRRMARAIAAQEKADDQQYWEEVFFQAMEAGFLPAGRICSAAGTALDATWINCFVQPIGDSITGHAESTEVVRSGHAGSAVRTKVGIYTALAQAAETMRRGGGVGYNFSEIRPRGALVNGTNSQASGPVSYMHVFDKSCETVESAGERRGAQMAVLRIDHPDIVEYINAKQGGELKNFNTSVGVPDAFMHAVDNDGAIELWHAAKPMKTEGTYQRADGKWVYEVIPARQLWNLIMKNTYNAAEPGVLYVDRINKDNNLNYAEVIEATNPCGEQPLPDYGCCCLGAMNLVQFIKDAFTPSARIDLDALGIVVRIAVRMLDNVLEGTVWPLKEQKDEAMAKRRIGLGFTGLGDALIMLGIAYDSEQGEEMAARIAQFMRDTAYRASVDLAIEKGSFTLFDAEKYLSGDTFAARLPEDIKQLISTHGIRNSHLISIAPTGTISLAFAGNTSNGIEPAFSWVYNRTKREGSGKVDYRVEDFAHRYYRHLHGIGEDVVIVSYDESRKVYPGAIFMEDGVRKAMLPEAFVSALEMSASAHIAVLKAVAPFVDSAISKTINVPEDYPFDDFVDIYMQAWKAGIKGCTTYRPNAVTGAVLSIDTGAQSKSTPAENESDPDRRIVLKEVPQPALASLRWPGRPKLTGGSPSWVYLVNHKKGDFSVHVSHIENGRSHPFEVWVAGSEQPRALDAIAKTFSMDMRTDDPAWWSMKLESLAKTIGDDAFSMELGEGVVHAPSLVAGFAKIVQYRLTELGVCSDVSSSPMVDALFAKKEPKSGPDGTLSWTVDIHNPATGDDFAMTLKECILPNGTRRPYSVWLAGTFPAQLDGLAKLLSLDMRVIDPAWIGLKLRKLLNFSEPRGDFRAKTPGSDKSQIYPSTVAYMASLMIHRFAMLGILDKEGKPRVAMGVLKAPEAVANADAAVIQKAVNGKLCRECNTYSVVKRDGCEVCLHCFALGECG